MLEAFNRSTAAVNLNFSSHDTSWAPIKELSLPHADTSLILIKKNIVSYSGPVSDPVFQANGTNNSHVSEPDGDGSAIWASDIPYSFIACADEHQFCNPKTGECTQMDRVSAHDNAIALFQSDDDAGLAQKATALRLGFYARTHFIEDSVNTLGNKGNLSQCVYYENLMTNAELQLSSRKVCYLQAHLSSSRFQITIGTRKYASGSKLVLPSSKPKSWSFRMLP